MLFAVHNMIFLFFLNLHYGMGQQDLSTSTLATGILLRRQVSELLDPEVLGIQCQPETVVGPFGEFNFPAINASLEGTAVTMDCPYGIKETGAELIFPSPKDSKISTPQGAQRICHLEYDSAKGYYGKWTVVDPGNGCRSLTVFTTTQNIQNIFLPPQTITAHNVKQARPQLYRLLQYSLDDYASASTLIQSIGSILETNEIFTSHPEDPIMATIKDELLQIIETYAQFVFLSPGERVLLETSTMKVESVMFPDLTVPVSSYGFETLKLSEEAISMARNRTNENRPMETARLQMMAYSNDLFFHWGEDRDWSTNSTDKCGPSENDTTPEDEEFPGKWRIISLYFDGVQIENLTEPIVYNLPVNRPTQVEEAKKWVCVFWDTEEKKWSSRGMRTLTFTHSIRCESSHLTAFSALLDPIPIGNPNSPNSVTLIPPVHLHILSVLSSVGSALSITGLAVTSLTYGLFRCMRKERSNKILLHVSLSLLFLHLMSMSSDRDLWHGYCAVPALLLHYFLLASLGWMLVEGVHMYQLLISVFVKPETRFLLKRVICAYGLPLVIVGVSGGIDIDAYNEGREEGCLMAGHMPIYLITYLGPAIIILAVNTFVFIRIIQVLCKQSSRTKKQQLGKSNSKGKNKGDEKSSNGLPDCKFVKGSSAVPSSSSHLLSPVQIKGAITVMLLLGVGWILGLFAIGPFQLVFRYLYVLFNGGQGVFIFLFRVILHPQACRTWRRALLGSSSLDTDGFSSGGGRRGQSRPSFSVSPTFISTSNSVENSLTRSDPMSAKLANAILASVIQQNNSSDNKDTKHY